MEVLRRLLLVKRSRRLKKFDFEIFVEVQRQHYVDRLRNQISLLGALLTSVFSDQSEHSFTELVPVEHRECFLDLVQCQFPQSLLGLPHQIGSFEVVKHVSVGLHHCAESKPKVSEN